MEPTTPASPQPVAAGGKQFSNRKWLMWAGVVVVIVLVVAAIVYLSNRVGTQNDQRNALSAAQISITSQGFKPATIRVKKGQSVVWTNTDPQPHSVTSDSTDQDKAFDSAEPLAQQETFTMTFDSTGTFTYHDQNNPTALKGTVEVVE